MTLFHSSINRDSVSLFKFPPRNHFQVIACAMPLICCLIYPYSCFLLFLFSRLFICLILLFLFQAVAINSLSTYSLSPRIAPSSQFLIAIVYQCHLSGVRLHAVSLISLFFGPSEFLPCPIEERLYFYKSVKDLRIIN